mgnify:CR=1 FL=1
MVARRAGLTLVELLVMLGVLAVLAGVALVGVRGAMESGREAQSLGNLRGHAQVFVGYAGDWDQVWPIFEDPAEWRALGVLITQRTSYFGGQTKAWPRLMTEAGYYEGWSGRREFFTSRAFSDPETYARTGWGSYRYGAVFLARPEYWRPEERTGLEQLGATRVTEVLFPSRKALHNHLAVRTTWAESVPSSEVLGGVHLSFVDGSAGAMGVGDVADGYEGGPGMSGGMSMRDRTAIASYTIGGVRGWDVLGR